MRSLTETLLGAQQRESRRPFVEVKVSPVSGGVVRPDWQEDYEGTEPDGVHSITVSSGGSLVRIRLTPASDGKKMYRQYVGSPGPGSDFSRWTYTGFYNAAVAAVASHGSEVSLVWIETNRQVRRIVSNDGGATFGSAELVDYAPNVAVNGLAASYRPNGDLAVFYSCQSTVYLKKRVGSSWQARVAWNCTTGILSGIAAVYDGDWMLAVSGRDTDGNYMLWSIVYGDGGLVPAGSWSALSVLASAPSGGEYCYDCPFLAKPDVYRCSFVETYTGEVPYRRICLTHSVPGTGFLENLWREPAPLPFVGGDGLALVYSDGMLWGSRPSLVCHADMSLATLDISEDIAGLHFDTGLLTGALDIELRNDDGRYAVPGQGSLALLRPGNLVEVSLGCVTAAGNEVSPAGAFRLESLEHVSADGISTLLLHASDAWQTLAEWTAGYQYRWNRGGDETDVADIIRCLAARAGLKVVVLSSSDMLTGHYPDFTVNPGTSGRDAVSRLLDMVTDTAFVEGEILYIMNPRADDAPVYSYGSGHPLYSSRYFSGSPVPQRVCVEGRDPVLSRNVVLESFDWKGLAAFGGRRKHIEDLNISDAAAAGALGEAVLRKANLSASGGRIAVPVNCGQQVGDVIDVTDSPAGKTGEPFRIIGMSVSWKPRRGEYLQQLELGAV